METICINLNQIIFMAIVVFSVLVLVLVGTNDIIKSFKNKKKEKIKVSIDDRFVVNSKKKLIENLLSVKVWSILFILLISTILVFTGHLTGDTWATVNAGVIATVMGVREAFKIAKVHETHDTDIMP